MKLRLATKKNLKLKKGGEESSKRATKQKPSIPSRKIQRPSSPSAFPVETKDFSYGDIHKPTTEQTIYGLHNDKIVPIEQIKLESDTTTIEDVLTPELLKKISNKTEKMKKSARKARMTLKKLSSPKKRVSRSPSSRSSELSIETGFARH
jgi:hypothetical protein